MLIKKVLNNNTIITTIDNKEVVAMGKGIAFSKAIGDYVDNEKIDKVFILQEEQNKNYLYDLVEDIPVDFFELANDIIIMAKEQITEEINENLYLILSDHIYGALERAKKGIFLSNVLNQEIRRFYSKEFKIALKALEMINERFGVDLPLDEAGFISLHIFNAQLGSDAYDSMYMTQIIDRILNVVDDYFNLEYDENNMDYFRFITHLKYFAYRLASQQEMPEKKEPEILVFLSEKYPDVYDCVDKIAYLVKREYNYVLNSEEKLYLLIHIVKVVMQEE